MTETETKLPSIKEPTKELPKLYFHCLAGYNAMLELAEEFIEGIYYTGFLNTIWTEAKVPDSYKHKTWLTLEQMGCITREFKGGGKTPSKFKLNFPPSPVTWEKKNTRVTQKTSTRLEMMQQQLNNIVDRLIALEAEMQNIRMWEQNRRDNS